MFNFISLSNNAVQMSVNILPQVISEISVSETGFAVQLSESTGVTNYSRFATYDGN